MPSLEAYGGIYDHPNKGHDRLYVDVDRRFFAVFDGAGGDELSDAACEVLPTVIDRHSALREHAPKLFMHQVFTDLDGLPARKRRRSTAALVAADIINDTTHLTYAHAGDSSIYLLDAKDGSFDRLAYTPSQYAVKRNRRFINTVDFLGAKRKSAATAARIGEVLLAADNEWTVLGLTDGVQNNTNDGLATPTLQELVQAEPADQLPQRILDCIQKYDDAALFVTQYTP